MNDLTPGSGEDPPHRPRSQTLALFIGIALIVATLANGAGFYLRKVGLVEPEVYRSFWALHCDDIVTQARDNSAGAGCCSQFTGKERSRFDSAEQRLKESRFTRYLYELSNLEIAMKLVKDLLALGLITFSTFLIAKRKNDFFSVRDAWPIHMLLVGILFSLAYSWSAHGAMTVAAGLRNSMFVAIALLAGWMAPHLSTIAKCIAFLLIAQATLVPFELFRGIHLHEHGHLFNLPFSDLRIFFNRVSGTLTLPNSMGAFTAIALAFYHAFSPGRGSLVSLTAIALTLIYFSGSGTGILSVTLFLSLILIEQVAANKRALVAVGAVLAATLLLQVLPEISGRPRIFESAFSARGRLGSFLELLSTQNLSAFLFGSGIGVNTNIVLNLAQHTSLVDPATTSILRPTDSTVTALFVQVGVLGSMAFYGALLWAALRDHSTRIFYAIVAVCSLTINITELFPANFLLGLALAHSMAATRK